MMMLGTSGWNLGGMALLVLVACLLGVAWNALIRWLKRRAKP
jgi:hypothetical protein